MPWRDGNTMAAMVGLVDYLRQHGAAMQAVVVIVVALLLAGAYAYTALDDRYVRQDDFERFTASTDRAINSLADDLRIESQITRGELLRIERRRLRRDIYYLEQVLAGGEAREGDAARLLELRDELAYIDRRLEQHEPPRL